MLFWSYFSQLCFGVNESKHRKENLRVWFCTVDSGLQCAVIYNIHPKCCTVKHLRLLCFSCPSAFKVKNVFSLQDLLLLLPLSFSFSYPCFWSPKTSVHHYQELWFMSPCCPLSAFQGELLPAELLPVCQTRVFAGEVSRFNMEECLNVVQLVGSHTGCCTSDSLCAGARPPTPHPPHTHTKTHTHYTLKLHTPSTPICHKENLPN